MSDVKSNMEDGSKEKFNKSLYFYNDFSLKLIDSEIFK